MQSLIRLILAVVAMLGLAMAKPLGDPGDKPIPFPGPVNSTNYFNGTSFRPTPGTLAGNQFEYFEDFKPWMCRYQGDGNSCYVGIRQRSSGFDNHEIIWIWDNACNLLGVRGYRHNPPVYTNYWEEVKTPALDWSCSANLHPSMAPLFSHALVNYGRWGWDGPYLTDPPSELDWFYGRSFKCEDWRDGKHQD